MASANAFALLGAGDDAADVDIGALVAAAPTKAVSAPAAPVEEKGESHPSPLAGTAPPAQPCWVPSPLHRTAGCSPCSIGSRCSPNTAACAAAADDAPPPPRPVRRRSPPLCRRPWWPR